MKKLIVSLVLAAFLITPVFASAQATDNSALIAQLQAEIQSLMQQIAQMQGKQNTTTAWCYSFNNNLGEGSSGSDVSALQSALTKEGFDVSGDASGTYGDATASAVTGFQQKYASAILTPQGLTNGTGYVRSATRKELNLLYGCSTLRPPTPTPPLTPPTTCTPNWSCTGFSTCTNGTQTQSCTDSNKCGVTTNEPTTLQSCTATCSPNWQCGNWSTCASSQQTRTCTDSNNCGISTGEPLSYQSCSTLTPVSVCPQYMTAVCGTDGKTYYGNSCLGYGMPSGVTVASQGACTTPTPTPTCTPKWKCSGFGTCQNGQQTQTCNDLNNCNITSGEPALMQSCTVACTPNWQCGGFGTCVNNQQTQTCTDSNNCGVTANEPATTQTCISKVTLNTPTLITSPTSTTPSKYVAVGIGNIDSGNNGTQATFNFTASGGSTTISELKFVVSDNANPSGSSVVNICIASPSGNPVGCWGISAGVADLTGLNLIVPNGVGGLTQNIQVRYYGVPSGTNDSPSGTISKIGLFYVGYQSTPGTTTTMCTPGLGCTDSTSLTSPIYAPAVTLVGNIPVITIPPTVNSGLNIGTSNQIGLVGVAVNAIGGLGVTGESGIKINTITFNVANSGFNSGFGITNPTLDNGLTPVPGANCTTDGTTTVTCTMGTGYSTDFTISIGTPQMFNLFATITGTASTGSTASVSSTITPSGFIWDDSNDGYNPPSPNTTPGAGLNGNLIYGFPSNSYTIHQ